MMRAYRMSGTSPMSVTSRIGPSRSSRIRRFYRVAGAALLVVVVAGGATAGVAVPCVVLDVVKYRTTFKDDPSTQTNDLADRIFQSFSLDDHGQLVYDEVGSKYSQPRTVSGVSSFTTPHRGTDFSVQWTNEDSDVHAVADGTLIATPDPWKMAERIDGTHFAVFMHVRPLAGFASGRVVVAGEKVARIGFSNENGGYNEHVHFGMTLDSALAVWRPISPFFAHAAGWRGGRDLEFISFPKVDEGNRLTVVAYTLTGGAWAKHFQGCSAVSVFYRKKGATAWQRGEASVVERFATGAADEPWVWGFDLGQAGVAGDAIQWYLVAYRDPDHPLDDGYDITIDAHNFALYPAGFAHPADVASAYPSGKSPLFVTTVLN